MPDESDKTRPDWESARATMAVTGPPPLTDGTRFDQEPPTGPPNPVKLEIPKRLEKIVAFFNGIILDESLLMDLCLERCVGIVERNVKSKSWGIDHFQDANPAQYAAIAGPLTVELYKQVLLAIDGRKEEYAKLMEEMVREREKSSPGGPKIIVPGA